jgi:hypothetical protein
VPEMEKRFLGSLVTIPNGLSWLLMEAKQARKVASKYVYFT